MPTGVLLVAERTVTYAGTIKPTPRKILDVGPGHGKHGVLLHEYLAPMPEVHAVEMWPPYVYDFNLKGIYDHVIIDDVCNLSQEQLDEYDLVVMGDVIEHIEKDKALDLLSRIKGWVIIATPVDHFHTEEGLPPTEAHVSHWEKKDFENTGRLERYEQCYSSHLARLRPIES